MIKGIEFLKKQKIAIRKAVRKYWKHEVIITRLQQAKGGYENAGKN